MLFTSLRMRLTLSHLVVIVLTMALSGLLLLSFLERYFLEAAEESLLAQARITAQALIPGALVDDLASPRQEAALHDFVLRIENELLPLLVPVLLDQVVEVVGVHLAGVLRNPSCQLRIANDLDASTLHDFAEPGSNHVTAGLHSHIHDHALRPHPADHILSHDHRCLAAKDLCRGNHDIGGGAVLRHHLTLSL